MRDKSQKLVDGPLKHIRAAALAAALVPLASVMATPASAQTSCGGESGGICGFVFNDTNLDGVQEAGESGLGSIAVVLTDGVDTVTVYTDSSGFFSTYAFPADDKVTISVVPTGQVSPVPTDCATGSICNGGVLTGGVTMTMVTASIFAPVNANFGFVESTASNPGTGTIGYWKNHPSDWPVQSIVVGGKSYDKTTAISWMGKVGKDKSITMFAQLVAALLSVVIGNEDSCVKDTITQANAWMALHPVGSNVAGSSQAWSGSGNGAVLEQTLDAYNNGQLCAPHRQ